jgi:type IV/VI secretion system ImpK/VasF family protein
MSSSDDNNSNRTVFRPSPLQALRQRPTTDPPPGAGPQAAPAQGSPPLGVRAPERFGDEDIPGPADALKRRNALMTYATKALALAASVQSGRASVPLPVLHGRAVELISAFDRAMVADNFPAEVRQRAKYAVCATLDDIAQNLPGQGRDASEWARRSLVVHFFQENIGGDRFWQIVDDMLARPTQWEGLIELYHACLAAGFQGRFRVMPDGRRRLDEIMTRLYGTLAHVRSLSQLEISPHWKGEPTAPPKVGFWSILALAGGAALAVLLVIYVILRLVLAATGQPAMTALEQLNPAQPLRLSRVATPPPATTSTQLQTLQQFLAPEIAQHLVVVYQDPTSVRVRTTVGQLFKSGSDQLDAGREELFVRIGKAVDTQPGPVRIEGYTDSDRVATPAFPDNMALSKARADAVATIIRSQLKDQSRVTTQGFGESNPIAGNDTAQGKSQNRRVEVVLQRTQ